MRVEINAEIVSVKLNEFTKDEWRKVAQLVRPDLTDDEYDRMWADFQFLKESGGVRA